MPVSPAYTITIIFNWAYTQITCSISLVIKHPYFFLTYHWLLCPVMEFLHFIVCLPFFCCTCIIPPFYVLTHVKLKKKCGKYRLFVLFNPFCQATLVCYSWTNNSSPRWFDANRITNSQDSAIFRQILERFWPLWKSVESPVFFNFFFKTPENFLFLVQE